MPALDVVEELRLRRWARENYMPVEQRDSNWHAVVLEEMQRKDEELQESRLASIAGAFVPLHPGSVWTLHGAHAETEKSELILRVPCVSRKDTAAR